MPANTIRNICIGKAWERGLAVSYSAVPHLDPLGHPLWPVLQLLLSDVVLKHSQGSPISLVVATVMNRSWAMYRMRDIDWCRFI